MLTREEFEWGMGVVKSRAFSPCNSVTGRVKRGRNGRGEGGRGKRIALEIASLAYGWFEGLTSVEIKPISLYLARRLVPQRIQSHALLPGIDMSNHRTSVIPRYAAQESQPCMHSSIIRFWRLETLNLCEQLPVTCGQAC